MGGSAGEGLVLLAPLITGGRLDIKSLLLQHGRYLPVLLGQMASSGELYWSAEHSGWAFALAQHLSHWPSTVRGQQVPCKPSCWHTGLLAHVSVGWP